MRRSWRTRGEPIWNMQLHTEMPQTFLLWDDSSHHNHWGRYVSFRYLLYLQVVGWVLNFPFSPLSPWFSRWTGRQSVAPTCCSLQASPLPPLSAKGNFFLFYFSFFTVLCPPYEYIWKKIPSILLLRRRLNKISDTGNRPVVYMYAFFPLWVKLVGRCNTRHHFPLTSHSASQCWNDHISNELLWYSVFCSLSSGKKKKTPLAHLLVWF